MRNNITGFLAVVAIFLFLMGCGSAQTYLTGQLERTAGTGVLNGQPETEQSETEEATDKNAEAEIPPVCFVHVSGAVQMPGVYELAAGSRLFEALEMAGGFTEDAAQESCNLAAVIEDGMQYHIPTRDEAAYASGGGGVLQAAGSYDAQGRLDLNRASREELMQLSGIGAGKAEAILAYRDEHGGFQNAEELTRVSGIGSATFEKLREHICVR